MALSCIYLIKSITKPDRYYIGSIIDRPSRWRTHKRKLSKNIHHSKKLQNHYNKYGLRDLIFKVLQDNILQENLHEIEQSYIDKLNPYFNSVLVVNKGCLGYHHSKEMRNHLSEV